MATAKKSAPKPKKPFVIDMRDSATSDSTYAVRDMWEEALAVAGRFWEESEGKFDPKAKQPFKLVEGYDFGDLEVDMRKGRYLHLMFANGDGTCIYIERASR